MTNPLQSATVNYYKFSGALKEQKVHSVGSFVYFQVWTKVARRQENEENASQFKYYQFYLLRKLAPRIIPKSTNPNQHSSNGKTVFVDQAAATEEKKKKHPDIEKSGLVICNFPQIMFIRWEKRPIERTVDLTVRPDWVI